MDERDELAKLEEEVRGLVEQSTLLREAVEQLDAIMGRLENAENRIEKAIGAVEDRTYKVGTYDY